MDLPSKTVLSSQQQQRYIKALKFIVGRKKSSSIPKTVLHSRKDSRSNAILDSSDSKIKYEPRIIRHNSNSSFQSAFATRDRYWDDDAKAAPDEKTTLRNQDLPTRIMRLSQSLTRIAGLKSLSQDKARYNDRTIQYTSESNNFAPETPDALPEKSPTFFKNKLKVLDLNSRSTNGDKPQLPSRPCVQIHSNPKCIRTSNTFFYESRKQSQHLEKNNIITPIDQTPCIRLKLLRKKPQPAPLKLGIDNLKENEKTNQPTHTNEAVPANSQDQHKIMFSLEGSHRLDRQLIQAYIQNRKSTSKKYRSLHSAVLRSVRQPHLSREADRSAP